MNKKRPTFYILDDQGNPIPEPDLRRWEEWFACFENRALKHDTVSRSARVSTVFVGLDYNFWRKGPPLLWETMILGGRHGGTCERYASRKDAVAGHVRALEIARGKAGLARQWPRGLSMSVQDRNVTRRAK
jgi:hypothetical protein